jgi:hypothetical protein
MLDIFNPDLHKSVLETCLTQWNWVLLEKLTVAKILQNFPTFYRIQRFITVFKIAIYWSLSQINPVHNTLSYFFKIHINITLPTMYRFSSWYFSFWRLHQKPICIHLLPHASYLPRPYSPPWLDHCNYIWLRVQIMKLLIMQFYRSSSYFIHLRSKYSPLHSILKYL